MYINKLFLKEFGKFNNREIKLEQGLNVLYGDESRRVEMDILEKPM